MAIASNRDSHASAHAAPGATTRFDKLEDAASFPGEPDLSTLVSSNAAQRQTWARRRWLGVFIASFALLVALLLHGISERTALMLGGSILVFALSADRLDQYAA